MGRLTVAMVRALSKPGRYGDGGTLFLNMAPRGSKSWIQRLTVNGKRRDLGLGGWPLVTLAEARDQAFENRRLARRGGDPVADKAGRGADLPRGRPAHVRGEPLAVEPEDGSELDPATGAARLPRARGVQTLVDDGFRATRNRRLPMKGKRGQASAEGGSACDAVGVALGMNYKAIDEDLERQREVLISDRPRSPGAPSSVLRNRTNK